ALKQNQTRDILSQEHLKQMLDVLETNGRFIENILNQYNESELKEVKYERKDLDIPERKEKGSDMQLDSELETDFKHNNSATQKKLFSYNAFKNPKVDYFFNVVDNGMHSFYIRKAIEFYVDNSSKFKNI